MIKVNSLRVSVTDRCNLRCVYCMPEGVRLFPHDEILRYEEIERVARAAAAEGVAKIRVTGGEPLVRRGINGLVGRLAAIPGVGDLPMTTNGVMLESMACSLRDAGLSRVTVSLDTLREDRYKKITGRPWLGKVLAGIAAAKAAGLDPVKVNVVLIPSENDDEALDFVELARSRDLEVRFIERMPLHVGMSPLCGKVSDEFIPYRRLLQAIEQKTGTLDELSVKENAGPARVFALPRGKGKIGFVSAMSEPFCSRCDRMRLTPDGRLRPCLANDIEVDVRGPIRDGADDDELRALWKKAVELKPRQSAACFAPLKRSMSQIGG